MDRSTQEQSVVRKRWAAGTPGQKLASRAHLPRLDLPSQPFSLCLELRLPPLVRGQLPLHLILELLAAALEVGQRNLQILELILEILRLQAIVARLSSRIIERPECFRRQGPFEGKRGTSCQVSIRAVSLVERETAYGGSSSAILPVNSPGALRSALFLLSVAILTLKMKARCVSATRAGDAQGGEQTVFESRQCRFAHYAAPYCTQETTYLQRPRLFEERDGLSRIGQAKHFPLTADTVALPHL